MRFHSMQRGQCALRLALLSLLLISFFAPASLAQVEEVEPSEEGDAPEERPIGLEEITVTAQKRTENIQDVPISVTALSEQFLQDTGLTDFNDLQNFAPNVRINPATDSRSTVIRIRGIGSIGDNAGIDPSVGVFIDGVYQGRAGMSVSDLVDIDGIQVLRGPQGTLYGKNTAAGAIVVTTRRPTYDRDMTLETVLGSFNRVEFRGSVNLPVLDERIATRLSGFKIGRDGYDVNSFNGELVNDNDKFGIRSKTLFDITPELSLLLSGDYTKSDDKCCVADIKTYEGPAALFVTFENLATNRGDDPQELIDSADQFDRIVGADAAPRNIVQVWGAAAELEYDYDEHLIKWLNAYRGYTSDSQFDGDFSVFDAVIAYTDTELHQFSSELHYTSPAYDNFDYQAGLYFYFQTQDTLERNGFEEEWADAFLGVPGPAENIGQNEHQTFSYAAYSHGTWRMTDDWSMVGGLRVTHEKKTRVGLEESTAPGLPPPVGGEDQTRDQERNVTNISGRITLQYHPPMLDDFMVYGSFANGFKSGGFNQIRTEEGVPSEFGDESSLTGEIGVRSQWFDRRVQFNLTGFYTDYDDFQTRTFDGISINIRNAASLESYGLESEFVYLPFPEWTLGGTLGWNIAKFKNFDTAELTADQAQEAGGGPPNGRSLCSLPTTMCGLQDLGGRTLDNAPEWSISAYTQYENLFPWFPVYYYGRADYSYTSKIFLAQDLDPKLAQPGYNLLNLRAGIRAEDDLWDLTFWVRNITDTNYNVVGFDVPIINGYAVINGPPREFGATIRVNF